MKDRMAWFIDTELFKRYEGEINKENRVAISLLAIGGLPITAGVLISQLIVTGSGVAYAYSYVMIAYFLAMLAFDRRLLPRDYPHSAALLYVLEAPVMLMSILLGTVWDPTHVANTILLFSLVMPAFILDYPWRSLLIQGFWSLLFVGLSVMSKEQAIWQVDAAHMLAFYLAASVVTNVILRIRLESLKHLDEAAYRLEHDGLTGVLNRYALQSRIGSYLRGPVTVLLADMDQFMLFNDFYGHQSGEAIMRYFAMALTDCFGAEHTYHYRGDEFLCVLRGDDADACLSLIGACRDELKGHRLDGKRLPLTCAFGYVSGTPSDEKSFKEMIQLADIYAHAAKKTGQNGTKGGVFDQRHLRAGIIESNMSTHARPSDIDPLTGLPGMSYFVARSDALLGSIADISRQPMVGVFKLMHLRDFNATFNYAEGDALIAEASRLLQLNLTDRYVCHITAAQFGIMCYEDEIAPALEKVNAALAAYKPGFPVHSKAGFARFTGTESAISLMDKAKLAQNSILDDPADWCFYDAKMDAETHFRQYIVSHVDEAVERGWLQVYYQPIARAVTGHICNEEALSRWDDPTYGLLLPYRFIPVLEESDQIYKVTLHVVRQVLKGFERRRERGVPIVPVSVNLSRNDLKQRDMVAAITELVDAAGVDHSFIKIEITESAFMKDAALLKREVARFREAGFDVWLDDFGSEYSTLNLLQDIDFDLIKIDMQFMKDLASGGKNYIIVSDIIDMARRMSVTTLVEGVETREQYRIMRRLGCEKIQGFLFNRPNPMDYIEERALNHTGLTFEDPADAPYYEAVGRVDLGAPMSQEGRDLVSDTRIATGVLQYRGGTFTCLRMTERFRGMLVEWNVLDEPGGGPPTLRGDLPESFTRAVEACASDPDWVSFTIQTQKEGTLNVYVRRVSRRNDGGIALLTVLLHNRAA